MAYTSGFCSAGYHEGTKPKSMSGKPMKVCTFWIECSCECHGKFTELCKMSDMEREPFENPDYVPYVRDFPMPIFGIDYGIQKAAEPLDIDTASPLKLDAPSLPAPPRMTPSGRTPRGGLEQQCLEICLEYMRNPPDEYCTTQYVSEQIARRFSIPAPSTGAVHSVFMRWEKFDFAIIGRKPVRFQMVTPEGVANGLDFMRALARKKK